MPTPEQQAKWEGLESISPLCKTTAYLPYFLLVKQHEEAKTTVVKPYKQVREVGN